MIGGFLESSPSSATHKFQSVSEFLFGFNLKWDRRSYGKAYSYNTRGYKIKLLVLLILNKVLGGILIGIESGRDTVCSCAVSKCL